jgi:uncharacterized protein (TIGR03492 family)
MGYPPRILLISNGHGEDAIGVAIGRELLGLGGQVKTLPLVGKGKAYQEAGFEVLGPRREMPSGGLVRLNPKTFWGDLKAGWLSMSLQHWSSAAQTAKTVDATLVVGDLYGLLVASLWGKKPLFQMQPLVSLRYQRGLQRLDLEYLTVNHYVVPERLLMRLARSVYSRDAESAEWLQQHGVPRAKFLGNPMFDAIEGAAATDIPGPYLLLLPGSRPDAYYSLPIMLEAIHSISSVSPSPLGRGWGVRAVIAWAGLPLDGLSLPQWNIAATGQGSGITHVLSRGQTSVYLSQGAFKTLLSQAKLALSTSGTAAEQAASFGIPVLGFPTSGPQYTPRFAEAQQRLLGEALTLTAPQPEALARGIEQLMQAEAYARASQAGRGLGQSGGSRRIAEDILHQLK